ncbi:MAG: formate dehydrogenase subunit gamma [Gammaproteobacteria bacterium]|nr:formate dehydrogenase subunit gamma [Gammaproteobacteria bacterium]
MVEKFFAPVLRRFVKFAITYILLVICVLPQAGFAGNHEAGKSQGVLIENPGSELWREVRQRDVPLQGSTQISGVDTHLLINVQGDRWARFRVDKLVSFGAGALVVIALMLLVFYIIRGKVGIEGGLSGRMVFRFSDFERIGHWVLALVFLFLAISGLILLLGRDFILPFLGKEVFSLFASASKEGHNLFGPIFIVSLLMMLFSFARRNIYEKGDLTWLLTGGGMIGKSQVTGGFFNMGGKTWYWMVILVGLVISVSGVILVSPSLGQSRLIMELSHVIHVSAAIILMAVSLGHMYLGSIGSEGSLEGMKTGYVDINWVVTHHDRWARECHENNLIISAEEYARLQGKAVSEGGLTTEAMEQGK